MEIAASSAKRKSVDCQIVLAFPAMNSPLFLIDNSQKRGRLYL